LKPLLYTIYRNFNDSRAKNNIAHYRYDVRELRHEY
jgi:hypothetical protein